MVLSLGLRIVIAMALACNPDILIADEPTTALDVTTQAEILRLISDLKEIYNNTIIFITHDFGVVADIAYSLHRAGMKNLLNKIRLKTKKLLEYL